MHGWRSKSMILQKLSTATTIRDKVAQHKLFRSIRSMTLALSCHRLILFFCADISEQKKEYIAALLYNDG